MSNLSAKKAIFLDRDGTLIQDGPYLASPDGIRFLEGAFDALRSLEEHGFVLILITNQSGVGRGFFPADVLEQIHFRLKRLMRAEGVTLEAIYYCPHPPEARCKCRKPESGMFKQALRDHGIDPAGSYSIGDKQEDAAAAKRIGCKTILLGSGSPSRDHRIDFQARDLTAAAAWILEDTKANH